MRDSSLRRCRLPQDHPERCFRHKNAAFDSASGRVSQARELPTASAAAAGDSRRYQLAHPPEGRSSTKRNLTHSHCTNISSFRRKTTSRKLLVPPQKMCFQRKFTSRIIEAQKDTSLPPSNGSEMFFFLLAAIRRLNKHNGTSEIVHFCFISGFLSLEKGRMLISSGKPNPKAVQDTDTFQVSGGSCQISSKLAVSRAVILTFLLSEDAVPCQ